MSTWLLAIARYRALSALRRRTDEHLDDNMAATIEDTADNPEVVTHNKDRNTIVQKCLTQLSPAHREVIDLVYYHEKSVDEVAQIAGAGRNREDPHVLCPEQDGRSPEAVRCKCTVIAAWERWTARLELEKTRTHHLPREPLLRPGNPPARPASFASCSRGRAPSDQLPGEPYSTKDSRSWRGKLEPYKQH